MLCFRHCFVRRDIVTFHDAVEKLSVKRLRKILPIVCENIDLDEPNEEGKSVLQVLSENNTCSEKDMQKIELLLSLGANPLFVSMEAERYMRNSILYKVFAAGKTDLVMKFLQHVDIHQPVETRSHRVPIHCAAEFGHVDILRYLLQKGSNVDHLMDDAMTPLHLSMRQPNTEITRILLANGADVNARNSRGDTTLHWACYSEYSSPHIEILLDHEADLTIVDDQGRTPLHIYLQKKSDSSEVCEKMLRKGSDLNFATQDRQTPLHCLASCLMFNRKPVTSNIARLLIRHGVSVNAQDSKGKTALHTAALSSSASFMFCLLREGADLNITDNTNCTAFSMYTMLGHKIGLDIIEYLTVEERKGKFTFGETLLDAVTGREEFNSHLTACRAELDVLASCRAGNETSVSLFDVLKSPASVVARLVRNNEILEMLLRPNDGDYPIFGASLWQNYVEGRRRKAAEDIASVFLENISEGVLDVYCCEQIMKFIPTVDLETLADLNVLSSRRKKDFWSFV